MHALSYPDPPLAGRHVRLEPLGENHLDALCAVGLEPELWQWIPARVTTREEMATYIASAKAGWMKGDMLPFVIVSQADNQVVGSTRYMNIDLGNRRVEIGSTWIAPAWQRTAINTETKLLLLGYAFETLGCIRVELKTDALNARSRAAIARLGAREEGTLRSHMLVADGRVRDTVYFSILEAEWPAVRAGLENRLKQG